jgi:SagB-type dehydrogenase family enzyme
MLEDDLADLAISELFAHDWPRHAPMTIFLTGIPERVVHKYGERGYRFMLLEAGHIGANLMLVIEAMGLSTVEIGGTHDEHIESFLDVDGINEVLLSTFVVGARGADVSSNNNSKNI